MSIQQDHKDSTCPGCGGSLKEVYAEANYGRYLILDQCQDCGGIWFNRGPSKEIGDASGFGQGLINEGNTGD